MKKSNKGKAAETSEYVGYLKEKREVQMSVTERQISLERKKVEVEEEVGETVRIKRERTCFEREGVNVEGERN